MFLFGKARGNGFDFAEEVVMLISITKWCFATKFYHFSLFIKTFLFTVAIALKIEFVVLVYDLIDYKIILVM